MNVSFSRLRPLFLGGMLLATVAATQATTIDTFSIGGAAEVSLTSIDFLPGIPGPEVNGTGKFAVTAGAGLFSPLQPDFGTFPPDIDTGTIVDRTVPDQQAGVPINVMNWITFDDPTFTYALDLMFIQPGQYSSAQCGPPSASGQTCTPAAPPPFVSPYNLSNFTDAQGRLSSNANFSVNGVVRNTSTGAIVGNFNGVLGAEFLGQSYQQVLEQIQANGGTGSVTASYSGTFEITAIPEPGSISLVTSGAALAALGVIGRRRLARK